MKKKVLYCAIVFVVISIIVIILLRGNGDNPMNPAPTITPLPTAQPVVSPTKVPSNSTKPVKPSPTPRPTISGGNDFIFGSVTPKPTNPDVSADIDDSEDVVRDDVEVFENDDTKIVIKESTNFHISKSYGSTINLSSVDGLSTILLKYVDSSQQDYDNFILSVGLVDFDKSVTIEPTVNIPELLETNSGMQSDDAIVYGNYKLDSEIGSLDVITLYMVYSKEFRTKTWFILNGETISALVTTNDRDNISNIISELANEILYTTK